MYDLPQNLTESRPTDSPAAHGRPPFDVSLTRTLRPRSYSEVRYVGHFFLNGLPVVMDLTDLPDADATPLIDFAAGLVYGRRGDMNRIAHKVFLLVPARVRPLPA